MKKESINEELLTRYLLGQLSEEEQQRIEELYFTDDEIHEQLVALEDELRFDYAQGKLNHREREQFEKRFLASAEDREMSAFASALASAFSSSFCGSAM